MGQSVSTIANHRLNTHSAEQLAADLAARLDCCIVYGYVNDWTYLHDYSFVVKGYAGGEDRPVHFLVDERVTAEYPQPEDSHSDMPFYCLRWSLDDEFDAAWIFRDCLEVMADFPGRWQHFAGQFSGKGWGWSFVRHFRQDVYQFILPFGGDRAIYVPDGGTPIHALEEAEHLPFAEVLEHARHMPGACFADICDWLRQAFVIPADANHTAASPEDMNPAVPTTLPDGFYDDFSFSFAVRDERD
jgi:hypothetical protein